MERFQKIVWHEKYKETYERLQQLEIDRKFCGHDIEQFFVGGKNQLFDDP